MSESREERQKRLIEEALGLGPDGTPRERLAEAFSADRDPGFDTNSLVAFVSGTASATEREIVESAIAIDPDLRNQVDAMLATKAELELAGQQRYGPSVTSIRAKVAWFSWGGWATATAAAALAGVLLLRNPTEDTSRIEALSGELAKVTASLGSARSEQSDLERRMSLSEDQRSRLLEQLANADLASKAQRREIEELRSRPSAGDRSPVAVQTTTSKQNRIVLQDGEAQIVETPNGLARVESMPDPRASISLNAEKTGSRMIEATRGAVRWPAGKSHPQVPTGTIKFELSAPVLTAVRETKPTFRFAPIEGAEKYVVRVYESNSLVAELLTSRTSVVMTGELMRGTEYRWTLTAISFDEREITVSTAGKYAAGFRVLSDSEQQELNRQLAEASGSILDEIKILAEFGLVDDAIAACDRLIAGDPSSRLARDIKLRLEKQRASLREKN